MKQPPLLLGACCLLLACSAVYGQDSSAKPKLNLLKGPARAQLGNVAQLDVPLHYIFINGKDYQALLKAKGEPVSGRELGYLSPTNEDWAVVFKFANIGFVKDDDKELDAGKLLDSIKRGTAAANKEREQHGSSPIEVVGWEVPPKYDATTHNLEWAIRAMVDAQPLLNYNTRLLGRKGVMEVVLITAPDDLPKTLPEFRTLLTSYSFQTGETYAEYRPGDTVAKYGLAALVVGGAAVGAAKLGAFAWLAVLFKKGFKVIIIAFVAVAAFFKKLFARLTGRADEQPKRDT